MTANQGTVLERAAWLCEIVGSDVALQARAQNFLDGMKSRMLSGVTSGFGEYIKVSASGYARLAETVPVRVHVDGSGFDEVVDAETASLIVSLFAWNWLAHDCVNDADRERVDDAYYHLRAYALTRPDAMTIFAALD